MKRTLLFVFIVFLFASCSKTPTAKVTDYGVYDAVVMTSGNWRLGLPVSIATVSGLKHQQTATRIPAENGRYWGMRVRITNPQKDKAVTVRFTLDHPEFTAPDGKKSRQETEELEVPPGEAFEGPLLWYFIAGCEFEFIPGTWTRSVFIDGQQVIKKEFEIYKP